MRLSLTNVPLRIRLVLLTSLALGALELTLILVLPSRMEAALRSAIEAQATSTGVFVAHAVAPALEFDDAAGVKELLNGFLATPEASYAVVRRSNGAIMASANPDKAPAPLANLGDKPVLTYQDGHLRLDRSLRARGGTTGVLTLGFSLTELELKKKAQTNFLYWCVAVATFFGLLASWLIGTIIVRPVRSMTQAALRIASGDLTQEALGSQSTDEIGQMATAFDRMLTSLRTLAHAAERIGQGDLTTRIDFEGQVAVAFNNMIEGQRSIISQMTDAGFRLAGAAAELYELVQRQEEGTAKQAAGVEEVSRTLQSLLESASNIAAASNGVFDNAKQTTATTAQIGGLVSTLGGHTNRIAEILEVIRDIADRSDLLALNASLESTRAGEAGRAFSLVASEMRRLAERVTAAVQDVKSLLSDIRSAGASTTIATDEGRRLADSTTESAHHITMVTQQQRTATEQVLDSMRDISGLLNLSVTSAKETGSSVVLLRGTAEQFRTLVGRFKIEKAQGA